MDILPLDLPPRFDSIVIPPPDLPCFELPEDALGTIAESHTRVSPGALRLVRCSPIILRTVLGADKRHTGQVFTIC